MPQNRPHIGQHLYLGPERENPVTVVHVFGTHPVYVQYVYGHVDLPSTHAGNLYTAESDRPYYHQRATRDFADEEKRNPFRYEGGDAHTRGF